jgi:hypothetical protein
VSEVLSRHTVRGQRRAQPQEVINRQVEIGDAEAADEDWLAEVQADAAVGAAAE